MREHVPVLLAESIHFLKLRPGGTYIDCTVGGGGHAEAILQRIDPNGRLLAIDLDAQAIERAKSRLAPFGREVVFVRTNFRHLQKTAAEHGFPPADGVLFDLGMSSFQLVDAQRGFSFQVPGPLDMRFDPSSGLTAKNIVNTYSEDELSDIFRRFGEEPKHHQIARLIVAQRPIRDTQHLAHLAEVAWRGRRGRIHPATRIFQALRIVVNQELDALSEALTQAIGILALEGRLVVISFHSLEDRLVKEILKRESRGCLCPPGTPICVCGHKPTLKILTQKVVRPSAAEIEANPRSRSAKLRAAERLGE